MTYFSCAIKILRLDCTASHPTRRDDRSFILYTHLYPSSLIHTGNLIILDQRNRRGTLLQLILVTENPLHSSPLLSLTSEHHARIFVNIGRWTGIDSWSSGVSTGPSPQCSSANESPFLIGFQRK